MAQACVVSCVGSVADAEVLDLTLCVLSSASGVLCGQLRQLAVKSETYNEKFRGDITCQVVWALHLISRHVSNK